ncbi:MAG: hypothetical protein OEM23_04740 [Gemmatimonadota bacterium]|nr:hypothetical protein [Gemmatimonadota bacterium]
MKRGGRLLGVAALPLALLAVDVGSPGSDKGMPQGCKEPFSGVRAEDVTYVLATTLADTVRVDGSTFGQAADVSRIGGPGADEVDTLPAFDRSVLLVPWGFDENCAPIPWTGSWRWSPSGDVAFYRGQLRPMKDWVASRPTLDVYGAVWEGFPNSPWEHPLAMGQPKLAAAELFELYRLLPTDDELAERPYGAVSGLVDWRREAGERAGSYPARAILETAFRFAEIVRVRKTPLAFGGTYRVHLHRDGDTLGAFLLRTGTGGSEPWPAATWSDEVASAPAPTGAVAVPAALALTQEELDDTASFPDPSRCFRLLGLRAAEEHHAVEDAARAWSAEIPLTYVATCFEATRHLGDLRPTQASPPPEQQLQTPFSGAFRQEKDGRFTFRQPAELSDGSEVMLQGERIGLETLPLVAPTDLLQP